MRCSSVCKFFVGSVLLRKEFWRLKYFQVDSRTWAGRWMRLWMCTVLYKLFTLNVFSSTTHHESILIGKVSKD